MKKILKWVGIVFAGITVLGIIAVATDDSSAADSTASETPKAGLTYKIVKSEPNGGDNYYRVVIPERYEKDEVIELMRRIKNETNSEQKAVAWFYIKHFSTSGAWASAAYLRECNDCTDKDSDGTPVKYDRIGLSRAKADSLRSLTLDTIANKKLVASWLEDIAQCKTEVYEIDGNPNRVLMVQLYTPGDTGFKQWLSLKEVAGEKRFYFDDETDGEGNYMLLGADKMVHFRNKEGVEWLTFESF